MMEEMVEEMEVEVVKAEEMEVEVEGVELSR